MWYSRERFLALDILLASFSISHRVLPRIPSPPFPPHHFEHLGNPREASPVVTAKPSHLNLHFLPSYLGTSSVPPFLHSLSNLLKAPISPSDRQHQHLPWEILVYIKRS